MTRKKNWVYDAGRGEECLYGRGKTGSQIKRLLLLFALILALFGTYGYAVDNIHLYSIDGEYGVDDEDGFIRSNEDGGEGDSIRIGAGESEDRTFIGFLSFDTNSPLLNGVTIEDACLVLTCQNNEIWNSNTQHPDQFGPTIDLSDAFSGNPILEVPDDRDASAAVTNCAEAGPWGMEFLEPGDKVFIHLNPSAIAAINKSGRTQFRINTGEAIGEWNDDNSEAMDFYDGSASGYNRPILWINPVGDWIDPPSFTEVVAGDPCNLFGGLNAGDTLTLAFDMNTNEPSGPELTKAEIDDLIDFDGQSLGADYSGVWTDPNVLVILVVDATGGDLEIGHTIAIKADSTNDLKNQAETSEASTASAEVSGVWGPLPPEISAAVASDPDHDNPALNDDDKLTLVFDMNTNEPLASTKALIDDLIDFGGKSLGTDYNGVWTSPDVLEITVVDASGGDLDRGDTISIKDDGTNDLKNQAETTLASTSSADVSGFWGPVKRDIYIGLEDANGQGPALVHLKFDPSLEQGNMYTLGAVELQSANVSHIEVDTSRNGQGGGIYIATNDGSAPNTGTKYLKEYRSDGGGDFIFLRESWQEVTDIAVSPADYGLYGFDKNSGHLVRYDPNSNNSAEFYHAGETYDDVNAAGEVAIGVDGWIHALYYGGMGPDDDKLECYTYNAGEFNSHADKQQTYVIDEMLMSPLDNTVTFDNKEEQGGALEQNAYQYHGIDGYETVCQTPNDDPNTLMPGVTDIAMLSDGTVIAVDVNSYVDSNVSLMGWRPDPHTIAQGNGQMALLGLETIVAANGDCNTTPYYLAVDDDDTVHVFGEGMLRAYRLNSDEGTFDLLDSLDTGAGTEIAASVYKTPPLPPEGIVYDLYDDFTLDPDEMNESLWKYMDPCELLLVDYEWLEDEFMCESSTDVWTYPSGDPNYAPGYGKWDFGDYYLLPWLNRTDCQGGERGEVRTFGPLLIRWTAPEAYDNVEIIGYLWQVNNGDMDTSDRRIRYKLWLNDDVNELATWHVDGDENGAYEDRDNLVYFDDGDDDGVVGISHIDANDTISLLIDGDDDVGNGEPSWGYVSFRIVIPQCYYGLVGDLNKDCQVDLTDVEIMATNWLTDGEPDYFHDSTVNFKDYGKLAGKWLVDCKEEPGACVPFMGSIDGEDGFIRSDDYSEKDSIRVGDNGSGNTYNSIVSFDTRGLEDVSITRAWIGLTVMNRNIWDPCSTPDPDKLNLTLDLCTAFNYDTSLENQDFNVPADVYDCAIEDDWGLTEAAVDEQVLIELNAAAIAAINTSGRTQFRINTGYTDDVNTPYGYDQADAIDIYDGSEDRLDRAPVLIVE